MYLILLTILFNLGRMTKSEGVDLIISLPFSYLLFISLSYQWGVKKNCKYFFFCWIFNLTQIIHGTNTRYGGLSFGLLTKWRRNFPDLHTYLGITVSNGPLGRERCKRILKLTKISAFHSSRPFSTSGLLHFDQPVRIEFWSLICKLLVLIMSAQLSVWLISF